jgi:hypothetical protein
LFDPSVPRRSRGVARYARLIRHADETRLVIIVVLNPVRQESAHAHGVAVAHHVVIVIIIASSHC